MLVMEDGRTVGSVSGGCLESDVVERAHRVMMSHAPVLETYDTTGDDDILMGLGMGCRGVVDILVEPLNASSGAAMAAVCESLTRGEAVAMATVLQSGGDCGFSIGDRVTLGSGGIVSCFARGNTRGEPLSAALADTLAAGSSWRRMAAGGAGIDVFLELLEPPLPLVIFGAGNDAQPLARFAAGIGWRVIVADGRSAYATPQRFREADTIIVSDPETMAENIALEARSAAVLMTHNYLRDALLLETLIASPVRYIGILGSRRRTESLLLDLARRGIYDPSVHGGRIHGPVGLDIGADTPETIAVAIVAEIQAVFARRAGGSLRDGAAEDYAAPSNSGRSSTAVGDPERAPFTCALTA